MPSFIAEHSELVTWIIGGLIAVIGSLISGFWFIVSQRLEKLEEADERLAARVSEVEISLEGYKEHIGAGDAALEKLFARVEKHMTEEEDQVWGGMDGLKTQLNLMQLENQKAHAEIINHFGPRLAAVETSVARIEKGLPNGELKEALAILRELKGR